MTRLDRLYLDAPPSRSGSLVCSLCGYGVARAVPPDRCPMCQETDAWVPARSRPSSRAVNPQLGPSA